MTLKQLFSAALLCCAMSTTQAQVTLNLDAGKRGATIGDRHYGIFFEEINHAGDGGLYAELIQNRSFEDNASSPDHWTAVGDASLKLETTGLLNTAQQQALNVTTTTGAAGVSNDGYWGMCVRSGEDHKLSFWIKSDNGLNSTFTACLLNSEGTPIGQASKTVSASGTWQKVEMTITATGSETAGSFSLTSSEAGSFSLDVVSLMPPTYNNRKNGCRRDLAQMLKDMKPSFVRFPGGCYVEGEYANGEQNRFEWKKTIGPIETRPGHLNKNWNYRVTDGFGFHEMLQLTEDLGAEPLFVVNMGMGHGWVVDYNDIDEYIQEALDAIEYCNGDVTTTWGAKRAENGHPAPFNLRLLEIGNENYNFTSTSNSDQSDHYAERYYQFYKAIKEKYPDMVLIGNVEAWGTDNPSWRNSYPVEAVDEHYYRSPSWFVNQYNKYDSYSRSNYKVYVGEYAVTQNYGTNGHLTAALGEAVFMQGMENNADVCFMNSYAPIFVNENDAKWKPDMIRFNSYTAFGTPSYYVQQLMPNNVGKVNLKWTEENNNAALSQGIGLSSWSTSVTYDNVKITDADGNVIFTDDFSSTSGKWTSPSSSWTVTGGALVQGSTSEQGKIYAATVDCGSNYTLELDATKTSGNEGFLIAFKYNDASNYSWWNLGGWGNTKHAVEVCNGGSKSTVSEATGTLITGQTYHIKIQVRDTEVLCYLDGVLKHQFSLPTQRKVYVSSSINEAEDLIYLKLVNPGATAQSVQVILANATVNGGTAVVLSSTNGTDENTMDSPNNVVPVEQTLSVSGTKFDYNVAPYSLNIIRLNVSDVTLNPSVTPDIPEPTISYSFENGTANDDSNTYTGSLKGGARIVTMDDGSKALYTGAATENGYLDMGQSMAQSTLSQLSDNYAISIDLALPFKGSLDSYCWAYALGNGTTQNIGLMNCAGGGKWRYTVRNGDQDWFANAQGGLSQQVWHNVVVSVKNGVGSIYVDGYKLDESYVGLLPSDFASIATDAFLGHSPYAADAPLSETYIDNFKVFNEPLSQEQATVLYTATATREVACNEVSNAASIGELQSYLNLFNYLHASTTLPASTASGNKLEWTLSDAATDYIELNGYDLTVKKLPQDGNTLDAGTLQVTLYDNTGNAQDLNSLDKTITLAPDDNRYGYLYCYMSSAKEITNYALGTAADKGKKFYHLLDGKEIFNTAELAEIEGGTRDAFFGRNEQQGGFYIATTDMCVAKSGVWNNYGMNLMQSTDLIHWTAHTFDFRKGKSIFSDSDATTGIYNTDEEYAKITRVWAPQVIWDPAAEAYLVYYSLLSSNDGDTRDRIFYSYTDASFSTLTQPRLFFDPGVSVIDGDIVYNPYDGLYHMYYKREGASGSARGVYEATCDRLVGGEWKEIMHVTNEGSEQVEGSTTMRRINEDVYNLYYMRYSGGSAYKVCETDYNGLNVTPSQNLAGVGNFQHGSVITVTKQEYDVLSNWDALQSQLIQAKNLKEKSGTSLLDAAINNGEAALQKTTLAELETALPAAVTSIKQAIDDFNLSLLENEVGTEVDITYLLANPDFTTDGSGWTLSTSFTAAGSGSYGVAEFFNKNFNMSTTLANMPAGKYTLSCQGFYRAGNISTATAAHNNGTEQLNAKLFINGVQTSVMSLYDESAPYSSSPYTYPDGTSGANTAFNTDGSYKGNTVSLTLNSTSNLTLGLLKEALIANDWTCFDNFKLTYTRIYSDEELVQAQLDELIAQAQALDLNTNVGEDAFMIPTAAASAVTTTLAQAQTAESQDEKKVAIEALKAAIETFKEPVLNAPAGNKRYNMVLTTDAGYTYNNKAVTYIAGGRTDMGGYNIQYTHTADAVYAQAFTFTPVEGEANTYTVSMTDVDNKERYWCTGAVYNGGNVAQIRTTTASSQAMKIKIIATSTQGIYNLKNVEADALIGSQDAGVYTVNANNGFKLIEATPCLVNVNMTAPYATMILPFNASIPTGMEIYSIDDKKDISTTTAQLVLNPATSIVANTPYIVQAATGATFSFQGYGLAHKTLYSTAMATGTYLARNAPVGSFVLQKQNNYVSFYIVGTSATPTVNAYKVYLNTLAGEANINAITLPDEITGISTTTGSAQRVNVYSTSGATLRLNVPKEDALKGLQKGVYVINNQKYIVK